MDSPLELLVVSHTHWDREWYQTAPRFRQRLVQLIDELLDDPPAAGESFLLDGQAIVLDDYLAVRPERAAELSELLRVGRIEAGPWYVLADGLIPSGEALVRNLLAGRDVLTRMRAASPPVLYCPDAFGHPAALPDLAAGFGLALAIVWRGYGGRRWPPGDSARWRGGAGATVLLHHLAPDGYELGSNLPTSPADARERWRRLEPVLKHRATLGIALLPNGADHHARQHDLRDALRALGDAAAPATVRAATLRDTAARLLEAAGDRELPMVQGELRDSYGYTWTLQGTLASRSAQKRRNAQLECALVRDVEPWIALHHEGGSARTRALLRAAWRTVLDGHPHDTLCGTSIDAVARALDARHEQANEQATGLREDALVDLLAHDRERARRTSRDWRPVVVVRNRAARARGGVVELRLTSSMADIAVGPGSALRQGAMSPAPTWRVDRTTLQILDRSESVALTESPRDYPDADLVAEAFAVGWIDPVPGLGLVTRLQGFEGSASVVSRIPEPVRTAERSLDNGVLRIDVSEQGEVRIEDRVAGQVIERAFSLMDETDVGDLYTPAIRDPLPPCVLRSMRVLHRGPIRAAIALDVASRPPGQTTGWRCRLTLLLDAGSRFVRVRVDGINGSRDHRLRLRVATALARATTVADAAFHPAERVLPTISPDEAAMEHVVRTAPLHRWVSRFTAHAGATLFSDGLAEYESFDDGSVAVTLVRAVGALSRHDLPERPGHAGWPARTPLAQCLGPFSAQLALALHGPDSPAVRDDVERLADDVLLPLTGETLRSNLSEPGLHSSLELIGEGLVFSAAAPAREPGWIVLRCVNRRDVEVVGQWRAGRTIAEARLARLDETPLGAVEVHDREVHFTAPARGIVTILVRWAVDPSAQR